MKGKNWGLGAFCYLAVFAMALLALPALLWFCALARLPAWSILVVVPREFPFPALRLIAVERGRVIAAACSGKIKTASTMVCICLMLLFARPWLDVLCAAVILVTTVYSGVEYFVKNRDVMDWRNL